jgi:hypothetical protein
MSWTWLLSLLLQYCPGVLLADESALATVLSCILHRDHAVNDSHEDRRLLKKRNLSPPTTGGRRRRRSSRGYTSDDGSSASLQDRMGAALNLTDVRIGQRWRYTVKCLGL